jgi:hypothetical protein
MTRKHPINKDSIAASPSQLNVKDSPLLARPEHTRSNTHFKTLAEGFKEKNKKERSVDVSNNNNNPQISRPHLNSQSSLPSSFKR